jgi:hypothetical protein
MFTISIHDLEAPQERRTELEEVDMPTVRKRLGGVLTPCGLAIALLALTGQKLAPAYAAESAICKYFSQLPDDCAGAEHRKYDNLRGHRYLEIDLFAKDVLKKLLYVSIYNTTGLNGGDDSGDSAPKALVQKLDPKKIAKQYQALVVGISPPRYWTVDWLADRVGAARSFEGLDAAWMGNSQAPGSAISAKPVSPAYRTVFLARTSVEGFKKGSEVYLLDDPKGRTWIMISYTDKDVPGLTIDKLESLDSLIKAPQGWKFRTAVLSKDLILEPKGGVVGVTQDDKENVYHLTGPGQSNFVP